jgi:hypothetical protein
VEEREDERRHGLALDVFGLRGRQGLLDERFDVVELGFGWTRDDEAAAPELPVS